MNQVIQQPINKYQKGKIYVIANILNGSKYYGSTCCELNHRKSSHDRASKLGSSPLYVAMRQFGTTNFRISLVKNFPCNNKNELEIEETVIITDARTAGEMLYNKNRPAVASTPKIIIKRAQAAAWHIANANKYQCSCCKYATYLANHIEKHLKSDGCRNKMPAYLLAQEIQRMNEIDY